MLIVNWYTRSGLSSWLTISARCARTDASSPLYGMPILDVDKARSVIFCKRSMGVGFAGVENYLFFDAKTIMVFGDAKSTVLKMVAALKGGGMH